MQAPPLTAMLPKAPSYIAAPELATGQCRAKQRRPCMVGDKHVHAAACCKHAAPHPQQELGHASTTTPHHTALVLPPQQQSTSAPPLHVGLRPALHRLPCKAGGTYHKFTRPWPACRLVAQCHPPTHAAATHTCYCGGQPPSEVMR